MTGIKAVAYARYSSDNQRDESIDAQLAAIRRYAQENGITIIHEYIDRAKTARTDNRPEFLNMINDSKSGSFQMVLSHKLDRFARSQYDYVVYKRKLQENGVKTFFVTEQFGDTPEFLLLEALMGANAEFYSLNLSREVIKGMMENAKKAKWTGGPPPFGFNLEHETGKLVINEYEAEAIRLIFRRVLEGFSYHDIIIELNGLGYKTRAGRPFGTNSLHDLLRNERYRGCYIFNKSAKRTAKGTRNSHKEKPYDEVTRIEDGHPRIISDQEFFMVQEKMKVRQQAYNHANNKEDYLLRGKIKCGHCGCLYVGTRRKTGNGSYYAAYLCNAKGRKKSLGCKGKEISKKYIEGTLLEKLADYVFADESIPSLVKSYNEYLASNNNRMELTQLRKRRTKVKNDLDNLTDLLLQSNSGTLLARLEKQEQELAVIDQRIFEVECIQPVHSVSEAEMREIFKTIRSKLLDGTLSTIKQVIEVYVHQIDVYDEEIIIQFNFFPNVRLPMPFEAPPEDVKNNEESTEGPMPLVLPGRLLYIDENGGGGGGRTPVRKSVHRTFYERSWCFRIPSTQPPPTGSAPW